MRHTLFIILHFICGWILLSFPACSLSDSVQLILEKADLCMEEYPDSALALLESISFETCIGESQTAYYSLLLTQALDKNGESLKNAPIASTVTYYGQSDDSLRKAKAFFYQGRQYEEKEEYEQAVRNFIKALTAVRSTNNKKYEALICSHLGKVNGNKNLFHQSLSYYNRAMRLYKEVNDSNNYVVAMLDLGYTYFYLEDIDSAVYYTQEALAWSEMLHDGDLRNASLSNLSTMYCSRKEYEKALQSISQLEGEEKDSQSTYSILSAIYLHLKQYDLAENYLQRCLEDKSVYGQASGYAILSDLEKERGNWKQAFLYKEKYEEYADSVFFQDNGAKLAEIQEVYQNQVLAHEKELLRIRNQRNEWILTGIVLIIVIVSFIIFGRYKKMKYRKERYIATLKQRVQENEEKMLQIQNAYVQHLKEVKDLSEQHLNDKKLWMDEKEQILQKWQQLKAEYEKSRCEPATFQKMKITTEELNETMNLIINFLDMPSTVRALTREELSGIERLVAKLFASSYAKVTAYSCLTVHEKQLWCLFQLGFSHASIAVFLCITPPSVSTAKLRLKKKIQESMRNEVDKIFL